MEVSQRWLVSRPGQFTPGKENDAHWIRGRVDSRVCLDSFRERKSLPIVGIWSRIEKPVISRYIGKQFFLNTENHFRGTLLLMLWLYDPFDFFFFDTHERSLRRYRSERKFFATRPTPEFKPWPHNLVATAKSIR